MSSEENPNPQYAKRDRPVSDNPDMQGVKGTVKYRTKKGMLGDQ